MTGSTPPNGMPRVREDLLELGDDRVMRWNGVPFSGIAYEEYTDGRVAS